MALHVLTAKSIDLLKDEERLGLVLQAWVTLLDLLIKVLHAEHPLAGFTQQELEHAHRQIVISPNN